MARKKTDIDPAVLEQLARDGMGRASLAKHFGLSYSGFCTRLEREPELREAFELGTRLHREDLYSKMVQDFQDPGTKANVRAQIYDKLSRWGDLDATKQLQQAVLTNLTDAELVALHEAMARRELETRLSVKPQAHEDSTDQVQVTEPS